MSGCLNCYYFLIIEFDRWCRHPFINSKIDNPEGHSCKQWHERFKPVKFKALTSAQIIGSENDKNRD